MESCVLKETSVAGGAAAPTPTPSHAPSWPPDYRPQHQRNAFAGFSRHATRQEQWQSPSMNQRDLTWLHKRHCPDDARSVFPCRTVKPMLEQFPAPRPVPSYWVQTPDTQLGTFSRQDEEDKHYRSSHGTRCEEWSSVREMLPSKGFPARHLQQRWGTTDTAPPPHSSRRPSRFPRFNSHVTNYADDVYANNKHLHCPLPPVVPR